MKKILMIGLTTTFLLVACGEKDPYADLRKMTVQDYLDNKTKMREVLDKCANAEIKDQEICNVPKKAVQHNYDAW